MKKIFHKSLLLAATIFLLFFAQKTFACQCRGLSTPYEAYKNADAVFVGKVISIKNSLGQEVSQNKVSNWWENYREKEGESESNHFAVQEWFKGEQNSEIIINTSNNMCENGFGANDSALIYAYKSKDGNLWTGLFCSRTTDLETAQPDIYFLRELLAKKPEPRIYGAIYLTDGGQKKYLEKIKIIAQSGKRQYITFTDKNGLYRFLKLPDGKYIVRPDLPNKYADDFWSRNRLEEIILQKNREDIWEYFKSKGPSAYSDFAFRWSNKISGRVLDAEGKPLERATIRLLQPSEISDKPFSEEEKIGEYLAWENSDSN